MFKVMFNTVLWSPAYLEVPADAKVDEVDPTDDHPLLTPINVTSTVVDFDSEDDALQAMSRFNETVSDVLSFESIALFETDL